MSTATPNIGLQIPATGSNNWYIPLNYNFNKIDLYLGGQIAIPNLVVTNLTVTNFGLNASDVTNALGYTPLNPANNLSELASFSQSLTNIGGVGISSLKGDYVSTQTYNQADLVQESGASYISLVNGNLNNDPATSPSFWTLFSAATTGLSSLTGDVTTTGSGAAAATVVGINGVVLSTLAAGIYKFDASGVPSHAVAGTDYPGLTTANTWTGTNNFSSGIIEITSGANIAFMGFSGTTFDVQNFAGDTFFASKPANFKLTSPSTNVSALQVTAVNPNTEMDFLLLAANGGNQYAGNMNVVSTGFLDSGNTSEIQFGSATAVGLPTVTATVAIGNNHLYSNLPAIFAADVTLKRHVLTAPTGTTTVATDTGAGTGATATIVGNDVAGRVTLVLGTGFSANNNLFKVTFAHAYPGDAAIMIFPEQTLGGATLYLDAYISPASQFGAALSSVASLSVGSTLQFRYIVVGYS